jgi:hypothetical protein
MRDGIYTTVYTFQRVKGMCRCGHELTQMLNSERFGHTSSRGAVGENEDGPVFCFEPMATRVWIVSYDGIRPDEGETKADHLTYEEIVALAGQPFADGNGKCDGCGHELKTELDFALHFTIKDRRYLNLGDCPVKSALSHNGNV